MTFTGNVVAESLRTGADLDVPLAVRRLRRMEAGDPATGQPRVWTLVEVEVAAEHVERLVERLRDALEPGPWYCDLASDDETLVVFAGATFRYARGDAGGRIDAEAHGRSVGVPEGQLDWPV